MEGERKELFSEHLQAGNRTYTFEIKQLRDGARYLVINEARQQGSGLLPNRVMVFEEHFEAFFASLARTAEFLGLEIAPRQRDFQ